ncbi:N-acetylglucosamine-6-phosphate deacetylase [Georgenia subflava]|uniref:Amidohydrolase family protein n=1 Tax=Georgenia subflava TaxID=1622177 RepID=A0A6N7EI90_9MICO|nr:amidohydrolase family protein [Georgenia subflava]MPV36447.1 amidohydrolase family protein [Georgenia subflava]
MAPDAPAHAAGPRSRPGLVDLQVNGYAGWDVNADDVSVDVVVGLTRALWAEGVTTYLPTVVTAPEEKILHVLRTVAAARAADPLVAHSVAGVHVEGPALAAEDGPRGAHDREHLRDPDLDELDRWQRAGDGLVRIVTLAPERPGAAAYIAGARARGVLTSVGHCAPTPEEVREAASAGATLSTHLGNGAAATLPRHPNHIWAQLAEDRLTAMLIADGHHLPADTLTAMIRAKSPARCVLTSDSAALAGKPPGDYRTPVGGGVTVRADGRLSLTGTELLAGSGRSLHACLGWARAHLPVHPDDLLAMATTNPARLIGVEGRTARDVVVLDGDRVVSTSVAGTEVYAA